MMFQLRRSFLFPLFLLVLFGTGLLHAQDDSTYRLVFLDGHESRERAEGIVNDLSDYDNVDLITNADGTYTVLMGRYTSRSAAEAAQNELRSQGIIALGIREQATRTDFDDILDQLRDAEWDSSAPGAPSTPAPPSGTQLQQQIQALMNQARTAEQEGNMTTARDLWERVRALAGEGPSFNEAQANIRRLAELQREQVPTTAAAEDEGGMNMMVVLVIAVVLIIGIAVVVLVMMKKTKEKNEELLKKVEQLAKAPPAAAAPSAQPAKPAAPPKQAAPAPKPAAKQAAAPAPKEEEEEDFVRLDANDRIRPGSVSYDENKKPEIEEKKPDPKKPASSGLPPKPRKTTPPPSSATSSGDGDEGLKLDFLFDEDEQKEESAPQSGGEAVQLGGESKDGSTEFIIPPQPDVEPGKAPEAKSPSAPAPAKTPADANIYYEQDFSDEEIGKAPANWRGEYEYANLTVQEAEDGSEKRRCMRFEKKTGIGSAYYSCRFPDARGRIGVEFDLRCDDKNKYLLGFYVEKDEDFRQSIHTIVHRTNSSANPTLRIQNESTPYEFGKWARVKFDIDLTRQLLDCYVDGEALEMGLRLNSSPKTINTLSIRDNLATTGVLMIANIKIYKIS